MQHTETDLLVICLCADWCGVCREYRPGFDALAIRRRNALFHWVDIEDESDWPDELEVESFPAVLIQRADTVLYFGPTLPQHSHLERTLDSLGMLSGEEARSYADTNDERRAWQVAGDFGARLLQRARAGGPEQAP